MDPQADEKIELARAAEEAGDLKTAIAVLRSLLAVDPERPATWAWLASLESTREQYAAAIDAFSHALRLNPNLAAAHSQLGQVYVETGQYEAAEQEIQLSIRIAPTASRYVLLGHVHEQLGHADRARKAYETALELESDNEEAQFNLALLIRDTAPDSAVALLERAIQIDPLYTEAHRELGFTLLILGKTDAAEDELRTTLALNANDAWAHLYLGNLLWQRGVAEEAKQQLSDACAADLSWGFAHRSLASFYEARGDCDRAEAEYRTAADLDPKDVDAACRLGLLLMAKGNDEARVWLSRALDLRPTDERAAHALAELNRLGC